MKTVPKLNRQSMGCAYEAPAPSTVPVMLWDHRGRASQRDEFDDSGKPVVSVCPGYTTTMPEVIDIARAHRHWSKGELTGYCHGYATTELMIGVEIFDGAVNECQSWEIRNPKRDGG